MVRLVTIGWGSLTTLNIVRGVFLWGGIFFRVHLLVEMFVENCRCGGGGCRGSSFLRFDFILTLQIRRNEVVGS